MSLVEIKKYLMQVKLTSLAAACTYFNAEPGLLRQMFGHWIQKGCLRQCMKTPACGTSCGKCSPEVMEIYEWVGS